MSVPSTRMERRIGSYGGTRPGPLLICVGGIHGNEPSGVLAARSVLEKLARTRPSFRGEFVALAGNLRALARERRFVERDLNRQWIPDRIEALRSGRGVVAEGPEDQEQRELLLAIETALAAHPASAYFLDLHTSSAPGPPFITVGDTLRNRAFGRQFPIPVVLGLEEQIDGPLLEYVNDLGHVTLGVEGGQHASADAVPNLEAVLWLALLAAGNLASPEAAEAETHRERLRRAAEGLPRTLEVLDRHPIEPGVQFRMVPGYRTLNVVSAGETVAHDRRGPVRVRDAGWLLLPFYQGLGNDGFFLAREVGPLDLRLSTGLRRLGVPSMAHWLPGVRRHPKVEGVLMVNTRIARFYPVELFHLLGYRKRRRQGDWLVVSRRRQETDRGRPRTP